VLPFQFHWRVSIQSSRAWADALDGEPVDLNFFSVGHPEDESGLFSLSDSDRQIKTFVLIVEAIV
jgi:hypothetical protein